MVSKPKCKLVIAGPGGGKTHSMVQNVLESMQSLHPARFCAVITYTNAATEEIKSRLAKKATIPNNVFIGTIHSFLNKFIVIPYLSLVNQNINFDKTFLQISSEDIVRKKMGVSGKEKAIVKKKVYESLNKKGLITFDQTVSLALETIKNKDVKSIICKRLQFLFIDEFQDIDNKQYDIFETIRKNKHTNIYCVGDPEQYISGYLNPKLPYMNIPILKASINSQYSVKLAQENHRSSLPIISFLNNFNGRTYNKSIFEQQKVQNENKSISSVMFITKTDIDSIYLSLKEILIKYNHSVEEVLILAKENSTIKKIKAIIVSHKESLKNMTFKAVELMTNIITTLTKKTKNNIIEEANISKLEFRKFIIKCLKSQINCEKDLINFIKSELSIVILNNIGGKQHKYLINTSQIKSANDICIKSSRSITISNIHKAKGLQSNIVLCIAKNLKELKYWMETDSNIREQTVLNSKNKKDLEFDDYFRIGYVAFSRARKLLLIACLENIDSEMKEKILNLKIEIIN